MLPGTPAGTAQVNRGPRSGLLFLSPDLPSCPWRQVSPPLGPWSAAVAAELLSEVCFWFEGTSDALIAVFIEKGQRIGGDGALQRTAPRDSSLIQPSKHGCVRGSLPFPGCIFTENG